MSKQVEHFFADIFQFQSQVHQHLSGDAFLLAKQAEQNVLGPHVAVIQIPSLFHRVLDDLLRSGRLRQLAHGHHFWTALHQLLDLQANLAKVDFQVLEHVGGHAATFLDQSEQDVLGTDVLVVESLSLLIGQLHDFAGTVSKSFVHCLSRYYCRVRSPAEAGFLPPNRSFVLCRPFVGPDKPSGIWNHRNENLGGRCQSGENADWLPLSSKPYATSPDHSYHFPGDDRNQMDVPPLLSLHMNSIGYGKKRG